VKAPHSVDVRSDVYSLGVTLYQLVTGKLPFEEENHFALLLAHVSQAPPPPSKLRPEMPAALDALILDALAKDPAARPQSCAAFRARLDAALAEVAPPQGAMTDRPLPPVVHDTGGYEMVLVPGGPFLMGRARRSVQVGAFYVDRTPVTNEQFARFVSVTGYHPTGAGATRFLRSDPRGKGRRAGHDHAKLPVTYVSWADASAYAHWAGKRLPTEAEWEKAARGTDGRKYPWGRAEPRPSLANFDRKLGGTTPVGSFPDGASPYGALDMAGNVWEWCEDYDDPSFYEDGPAFDPCNRSRSAKVVMRGGAWMFGPQALRTFARTSYAPEYRFAAGGFRCARTA
jgi:serine/threonine-protein kinase